MGTSGMCLTLSPCAAQSKDKAFKLIPGRWHVLLKEPGNEDILKEVIAWLKERV